MVSVPALSYNLPRSSFPLAKLSVSEEGDSVVVEESLSEDEDSRYLCCLQFALLIFLLSGTFLF
jgi:hypothetical protein